MKEYDQSRYKGKWFSVPYPNGLNQHNSFVIHIGTIGGDPTSGVITNLTYDRLNAAFIISGTGASVVRLYFVFVKFNRTEIG